MPILNDDARVEAELEEGCSHVQENLVGAPAGGRGRRPGCLFWADPAPALRERLRELENFLALVYYDHYENEMCIDVPHGTRSFWGKTAIECFENFVQYYRELKEAENDG